MPKQVKKDIETLQNGFQLHYFPNIPVGQPSSIDSRQMSGSAFKRTHFKNCDRDHGGIGIDQTEESEVTPAADEGLQIDEIKKSAFQKGFVEGKNIGFETGIQKINPVINSLQQALEQLKIIRKEIHHEIEKEVIKLALAIAKKIVCHEVKTSQETIVCVAREALNHLENPTQIKLKLNPTDLQFIKDTKSQLSRYFHDVENIRFEAEDSIERGGCVIETDMGEIDARLEKQLQAIEESFQTQFELSKKA